MWNTNSGIWKAFHDPSSRRPLLAIYTHRENNRSTHIFDKFKSQIIFLFDVGFKQILKNIVDKLMENCLHLKNVLKNWRTYIIYRLKQTDVFYHKFKTLCGVTKQYIVLNSVLVIKSHLFLTFLFLVHLDIFIFVENMDFLRKHYIFQ